MNEKLLLKCRNVIVANAITNLLRDENIAYRQHDESLLQRSGVYGPITGVAIYVLEKDYDMACDIVEPIIKEIDTPATISPNCDSENVRHIIRNDRYTNAILLLAIFFILAPGVYFVYVDRFGLESTTATNYTALVMLSIGIALPLILQYTTMNRKRKRRNKKTNTN